MLIALLRWGCKVTGFSRYGLSAVGICLVAGMFVFWPELIAHFDREEPSAVREDATMQGLSTAPINKLDPHDAAFDVASKVLVDASDTQSFQQYFDAVAQIAPHDRYDAASLQHFFAQIWALQEAHFSAQEIEVHFAEHRRLGEMVILQTQLQESDLSPAERAAIYDDWIAQQPQHYQQVHHDKKALKQLMEKQDAQGNLHTDFGPEVAQRMAEVEAKRADFHIRFKDFKLQYQALESMGHNTDVFAQEKSRLMGEFFSQQEYRRVDVFLRNPELIDP